MFKAVPRCKNRILSSSKPIAVTLAVTTLFAGTVVSAQDRDRDHGRDESLRPGNLLVSRSVYENNQQTISAGTQLPPGCVTGCVAATNDGQYPYVWNNDLIDGSFGITAKILLDQITPTGRLVSTIEVPNSTQRNVGPRKDQMVTSFPSKSELALNLSTDSAYVTFMGYYAPVDAVDVSNSNTPSAVDSTNPVPFSVYRAIARMDRHGRFGFTLTNAYSGNNGRAAIYDNARGADVMYTAGNAGNGSNPQPLGIVLGAGAQMLVPAMRAERMQNPGTPTPVGSFSVTELGAPADKIGKDDNFRGLTIYNNVVYYTKGSGGNGVNTVYFIDPTGKACPNGVGLPLPNAPMPQMPIAYDSATVQSKGLSPNMCILKGFPVTPNSALKKKTTAYPFGIWFANATTLYVADEGDGAYADAGVTPAGLQKWVLTNGTWTRVYTMQTGLGLGQSYHFEGDANYPTGVNAVTGLPWAPLTDGLRNITGRVNRDGTVTIWGITSTVSGNGDQGADPNKLVAITDVIANTNPAVAQQESFTTVRTARYGEVLRGVSFTPHREGEWSRGRDDDNDQGGRER